MQEIGDNFTYSGVKSLFLCPFLKKLSYSIVGDVKYWWWFKFEMRNSAKIICIIR